MLFVRHRVTHPPLWLIPFCRLWPSATPIYSTLLARMRPQNLRRRAYQTNQPRAALFTLKNIISYRISGYTYELRLADRGARSTGLE
jgi:hypothetical protein